MSGPRQISEASVVVCLAALIAARCSAKDNLDYWMGRFPAKPIEREPGLIQGHIEFWTGKMLEIDMAIHELQG